MCNIDKVLEIIPCSDEPETMCSVFECYNDDLDMFDITIIFDGGFIADEASEWHHEKSSWMVDAIQFYYESRGYMLDTIRDNCVVVEKLPNWNIIELDEALNKMGH